MKTPNRRNSSRGVVPISVALLSLLGATAAGAAGDTQPVAADSSCQREIRRIAIWPHGSPKAPQFARFEDREVTVCNGKMVAQPKRADLARAPAQP